MKPAQQLFLGVALVLAVLGVLATGGLSFAIGVGLLGYVFSLPLIRIADPDGQLRLGEIFAVALALRFAVAAFGYLVINAHTPGALAPDEIYYDNAGLYFSEYLKGHVPNPYPDNFAGGVLWTSGISFYVFGFAPMVPRILNGLLGGWTAVVAALIARHLLNHEVGRRAGLIAAVTPSLVLWSSLNTKDNSTLLGAEVALLAFVLMRERFRLWALALFGAGLMFIAANRTYEVLFVGAGVVAGFAFARRQRILRNIVVGLALAAVLGLVLRATRGADIATENEGALDTIASLREAYASGAGSAININLVDTSTAGGLALWAPIGLFYFYFAPVPFTGGSLLSLATTPEMLIWYYLLPSAFRGALFVTRRRFQATMPLLVYVGASSIGWSLVVTNVGTLYRYRSQVLFIPIIFIAADMVRRKHLREQRAAGPLLGLPALLHAHPAPLARPSRFARTGGAAPLTDR